MKFGPVATADAKGAILAHSVTAGGQKFRKAHVLSAEDISLLLENGHEQIIAASLEPGDIGENEAAQAIVEALDFPGVAARAPATGRVNLHAQAAGLFTVDAALVDAINAVDPAMTIATVANRAAVERDQMVATVKIIPYAVPGQRLNDVLALARGRSIFRVDAFRAVSVGMIQTTLPGLKDSVLDKTVKITQTRLDRSGSRIGAERRVAHQADAVAMALRREIAVNDMALVFGASAVSDDDDVIPAAIRAAGGNVVRTGMPVDPGNLLVLGAIDGKPVIGAPGCARSPKENGFDWVLDRVLAGQEVTDRDIAGMGVGGLLMEIATRPQPREARDPAALPKVTAVVLAAGRSSRMGGPNKLMAVFDGAPLVRRMTERALASAADTVLVVTGHQAERVAAALEPLNVTLTHNADYATGLASSLKAGIAALPKASAGALIVLGDMPGIAASDLDRMITVFRRAGGTVIVRATHNGKRGNPVLLPRALFAAVAGLEGDTGARHLVESGQAEVIDVELGEGASLDVDTPEAMAYAGGALQD